VFGSAEGTGPGAQFSGPQGVAVDSSGYVYVADTGNSTIRKLTPGGTSSTLAGLAGDPGNADGTGTSAQFNHPEGVAVDSSGNVYVADTWNHTIRKLTSGGTSSTLAGMAGTFGSDNGTNSGARFNDPTGVAVDGSGNVYVTDYNNNTIREVTPAGVVTTLAGSAGMWGSSDGTNGNALFFQPTAISVNSAGTTLYVVDSGNNTLRKIVSSGGNWVVSTVAGLTGVIGSSDGTGTAAEFYYPQGVAVDNGGIVYVADTGNNTIRSQGISPTIITEPQSQTNQTGTPATFSVTAFGSMPLSYIWQSNSITLAPSSSSSLTTIAAGEYQVTVSNAAGIMLSTVATLTLTNSPVGTNGVFNSVTVLNNRTVKFSLSGTSGSTYSLDVSTNLVTWSTLTTFVMTNGSVIYTDVTAPNFPTRFYMLVSP
jgi:sugar lactone lactonase YvrE